MSEALKVIEDKIETTEEIKLIKLDLGCGSNKKAPDYTGVDFADNCGADVVHNLKNYPWPWENNSVDEIHSAHFLEHLTGMERIAFMNECYRILKPGKQLAIICPYWSSMRAYGDPTHQWPPVSEMTFMYYNKGWRETNKLTHGDYATIVCDFDFGYAHVMDGDVSIRNEAFKQDAVKYKVNSVMDIYVTLTKK